MLCEVCVDCSSKARDHSADVLESNGIDNDFIVNTYYFIFAYTHTMYYC
jgi:hypothetical protein